METGTDTVSRTSQTGCEQGSGGENRRQSSRPVADCALARSHHRFAKCLLCPARASTHGRAVLAQSAEPPYADPHVRWCGRGGGATRPPMPIAGGGFEPRTFGSCDLTHLSMRVGLYLHHKFARRETACFQCWRERVKVRILVQRPCLKDMLADHRKNKKSALTPKGLRLLRETPFEPRGLRVDFCLGCWGITSRLPVTRPQSRSAASQKRTSGQRQSPRSSVASAPP